MIFNPHFHKSHKLKALIEAVGCKLIYLPLYSPDLNPIEHVWANLKRIIRVHPNKQENLNLANSTVYSSIVYVLAIIIWLRQYKLIS